jgi:hypothetical protein
LRVTLFSLLFFIFSVNLRAENTSDPILVDAMLALEAEDAQVTAQRAENALALLRILRGRLPPQSFLPLVQNRSAILGRTDAATFASMVGLSDYFLGWKLTNARLLETFSAFADMDNFARIGEGSAPSTQRFHDFLKDLRRDPWTFTSKRDPYFAQVFQALMKESKEKDYRVLNPKRIMKYLQLAYPKAAKLPPASELPVLFAGSDADDPLLEKATKLLGEEMKVDLGTKKTDLEHVLEILRKRFDEKTFLDFVRDHKRAIKTYNPRDLSMLFGMSDYFSGKDFTNQLFFSNPKAFTSPTVFSKLMRHEPSRLRGFFRNGRLGLNDPNDKRFPGLFEEMREELIRQQYAPLEEEELTRIFIKHFPGENWERGPCGAPLVELAKVGRRAKGI